MTDNYVIYFNTFIVDTLIYALQKSEVITNVQVIVIS